MFGKVPQSQLKPTIAGIQSQTSVYGATIPDILGTVMTSPLPIWLNNIREAASAKKSGKKGKGGPPTYNGNVDMLVGHNPIVTILRVIASKIGLGLVLQKLTVGVTAAPITIPDPDFYAVVAMTATLPYNVSFNDYGAPGSVSASGNYDLPLWNAAYRGPNPTDPSMYRFYPWVYYWRPGSGPTVTTPPNAYFGSPATAFNIYYARLVRTGWGAHEIPLAKVLNCAFESSLGDNAAGEFFGYEAQDILYPMYAGIASAAVDLGYGSFPQMKIEALGAYGLNPDTTSVQPAADIDFADMAEHIFRSGQRQAAMLSTGSGQATGLSPVQTGLSAWEYPGAVQKFFDSGLEGFQFPDGGVTPSLFYHLPVTKGSVLIVAVNCGNNGQPGLTIADTLGNTWTPIFAGSPNTHQLWYAIANASGEDTILLPNGAGAFDIQVFEIGGVTVVDSALDVSAGPFSITTSNPPGTSAYLMFWLFKGGGGNPPFVPVPWKDLIASQYGAGNANGFGPSNSSSLYRIVNSPGTYTLSFPGVDTSGWTVAMLALKRDSPPNFPKPLGNILDDPTLQRCRLQCRAAGLWGSVNMNSQKKAGDWLDDVYTCMDSAFVWSGFKGKSIPRSEVSAVGNGAIYVADTAAGPVAELTESDYLTGSTVNVQRKQPADRPTLLRVSHPDRLNNYHTATVPEVDTGGLSLYGLRHESPKVLEMIQRIAVARMVLGIMIRRRNYLVNSYKFTLQAKWKLLEAMDLVTITESKLGMFKLPVRLTSVSENDKYELQCEAEDFIYGLHSPVPLPVTENQATPIDITEDPGNVNAPLFFVEQPGMSTSPQPTLGIALSGQNPANWGGCLIWASADGISGRYDPVGEQRRATPMGVLTADFPATQDPDNSIDLSVDLTESAGLLSNYSLVDENNFVSLFILEGGEDCLGYELGSYAVETPSGNHQYTISGTGGNTIRRGLYATQIAAHAIGQRFAFLGGGGLTGIAPLYAQVPFPESWVGKTIYFKFPSFNIFGSALQNLADVTAYPYTIPIPCAVIPPVATTLLMTPADDVVDITSPSGAETGWTLPHGVGYTPAWVQIEMFGPANIWLDGLHGSLYDGTNLYLRAASVGLIGKAFLWRTAPATILNLAPTAPGDFQAAQSLAATPGMVLPAMTSGGNIWSQPQVADDALAYFTASDAGVTAIVALWLALTGNGSPSVNRKQVPLLATADGNFQVAHGLGIVPKNVFIHMASPGFPAFWFQNGVTGAPLGYDDVNIYLVSPGPSVSGFAEVLY